MNLQVKIINQLTDNYSYIIFSKEKKEALVLDPAEPKPILNFLNSKELSLKGVLVTHHHSDHTQGVQEIKNRYKVEVYSPNNSIVGTTNLLVDKQKVDFGFVKFEIFSTPGHTLDHIVYYNNEEKILFSGDTLFYHGCGRIFEGTNEQMLKSLNKLKLLPNDTKVYCSHEYTYKNLEFVLNEVILSVDKEKILSDCIDNINKYGSSMPFYLGNEKEGNPFLNCDNKKYKQRITNFPKNKGKISTEASELEFFTFIREKRNNY